MHAPLIWYDFCCPPVLHRLTLSMQRECDGWHVLCAVCDPVLFVGDNSSIIDARWRRKPQRDADMQSKLACRDEALYSSTNGGSRYTFDPDYGGKVSMPKAHHPQPIRPDTTMSRHAPDASRPRALFADDRSRYAEQQAHLHWQALHHEQGLFATVLNMYDQGSLLPGSKEVSCVSTHIQGALFCIGKT